MLVTLARTGEDACPTGSLADFHLPEERECSASGEASGNPIKECPQPRPTRRIDPLNIRHSSTQVRPKVGVAFAVLPIKPMPAAVGQRGLEAVIDSAVNVEVIIDDESAQPLADTAAHDARLAMMNLESLVVHDLPHEGLKPFEALRKARVTREGQVIGVAGLGGANRFCGRRQAAIQPERGQIRQRR